MCGRPLRQAMPSASRMSLSRPLTAARISFVRTKRSALAGIAAPACYRSARKRLANFGGNAISGIGFVPQNEVARLQPRAALAKKPAWGFYFTGYGHEQKRFCKIP